MKKSERLKPKKKRKYRIDHSLDLVRWEQKYNGDINKKFEEFREKLFGVR